LVAAPTLPVPTVAGENPGQNAMRLGALIGGIEQDGAGAHPQSSICSLSTSTNFLLAFSANTFLIEPLTAKVPTKRADNIAILYIRGIRKVLAEKANKNLVEVESEQMDSCGCAPAPSCSMPPISAPNLMTFCPGFSSATVGAGSVGAATNTAFTQNTVAETG